MTASTKSRAAASSSIRRVVRARSTARPASSSGQVGPGRRCPGGRPPPGSHWSPSGPACPAAPSSTPPRSHRTTRGRPPPTPKPGAVRLLDAAILAPTPTIGRPEGTVLVSGDPEAFAPHAGTLRTLGTVRDAGADPGRAAAFDTALLDLIWTTVHGLVHALALSCAEGIGGAELTQYAQGLPRLPPPPIEDLARRADDRHQPGDHSSVASAAAGPAHVAHTARPTAWTPPCWTLHSPHPAGGHGRSRAGRGVLSARTALRPRSVG
ncbi:hypothetical protein [Streptomyces sp. 1114.5]|uniref:imine reductase family protein n=1 Tax=Streptomyces sp. 1114.5 TaxID=1938830 RepID=UPI0011C3A6D5|nr:hypothetical protein [Streptomyces sp. 1114.5]